MDEQIIKLEEYIYIDRKDPLLNTILVPIHQIFEYQNIKYKMSDKFYNEIIYSRIYCGTRYLCRPTKDNLYKRIISKKKYIYKPRNDKTYKKIINNILGKNIYKIELWQMTEYNINNIPKEYDNLRWENLCRIFEYEIYVDIIKRSKDNYNYKKMITKLED